MKQEGTNMQNLDTKGGWAGFLGRGGRIFCRTRRWKGLFLFLLMGLIPLLSIWNMFLARALPSYLIVPGSSIEQKLWDGQDALDLSGRLASQTTGQGNISYHGVAGEKITRIGRGPPSR